MLSVSNLLLFSFITTTNDLLWQNFLKVSSSRFITQGLVGTRQFNKYLSTEAAKNETSKDTVSQNQALENEEEDKLFCKLEIELRAHDQAVMKSYSEFATMTANNLGIEIGNW